MGTLQSKLDQQPANVTERRIAELDPWFHNIRLPDGTQTAPRHPLGDFPLFKWRQIAPHIPHDLSGWRVLDVGCNAGFYSIELARRGATVDAMDVDPHYLEQARWVVEQWDLAARIHVRQGSVYQLLREPSTYDLVWFMGVFYHLRHPLLALDILARKAGRLMVFQTLETPGNPANGAAPESLPINERSRMAAAGWPRMSFIENALADDRTNWWAPDAACALALLRAAGMRPVVVPEPEIYVCEPDPDRDSRDAAIAQAELDAITGVNP